MLNIINDIHTILFPKVCFGCNALLIQGERCLCAVCRHELPFTDYHLITNNPVEKVFYGRIPLEKATSFLFYEKNGSVQNLIHYLKYKNQAHISEFLGNWMGEIIKKDPVFSKVDLVIPVPLHKDKLKKRGYNQVTGFGREIAKHLQADYLDNILIRTKKYTSQTLKNRLARWSQNNLIFSTNDNFKLEGKHILLVDDIITTGATLEACANALKSSNNIKISIITMAFTN